LCAQTCNYVGDLTAEFAEGAEDGKIVVAE